MFLAICLPIVYQLNKCQMNTSVKIVLKPDYTKKDGTRNVRLRLTINRKVKYFPLYVYVLPKHFAKGKVSKSDPDHFQKNMLLDNFSIKAKKIIFDARINDSSITFDSFERNFTNNIYGSKSFYDFVDLQIITTDYNTAVIIHNELVSRLNYSDISIYYLPKSLNLP